MNQWTVIKNGEEKEFSPNFSSILNFIEQNDNAKAIIPVGPNIKPITYKDLASLMRKTIAFFIKHLKEQDSIGLLMDNKPELLVLSWSAWSSNYKTVPLDIKRDSLERKIYKLQLTNAKMVFVRTDQTDALEIKTIQARIPKLIIIRLENDQSFFDIIKRENEHKLDMPSCFNKDCLILFTSGTTGNPKGARLTPRSLCTGGKQIVDWLKLTKEDKFHILLPLHHINSTTFALATILASGSIVLSTKYSKSNFWRIANEHNVTVASIVPTIAYDLLSETKEFIRYPTPKFSRIQLGSAPVQPNVVKSFYEKYKIPLVQGYGSTETSLRCTGTPYPVNESTYLELVTSNSIGEELKWNNVAVLDMQGNEVPEGSEGNICVRGPNVMQGYSNEDPQSSFKFGWFNMGDLGYYKIINGKRLFFLNGRSKEIIIKGGLNISPLTIENAILAHFDIDFCYAFGFSDTRLGEDIAIVCKGKEVQLLHKAIKEKSIPNLKEFEHPKEIIEIEREDLPKTSTGKVQRFVIKEKYAKKALMKNLTIHSNPTLLFRIIQPSERNYLEEATKIHNSRWPEPLSTTFEKMESKSINGFVIGAFKGKELIGTISGFGINMDEFSKEYTQTWDGITDNGFFAHHNRKGDSIVCTAISIKSTKVHKNNTNNTQESTSDISDIRPYINKDPVIEFHLKPKAGMNGGNIFKVIQDGRPKDTGALGYSVLIKYDLSQEPKISEKATFGTQLLEAALLYAYKLDKRNLIAYSRPSSLRKSLMVPRL